MGSKTVVDLGKFRPGDYIFVISNTFDSIIDGEPWCGDEIVHPASLFKYGLLQRPWPKEEPLPRLLSNDFEQIFSLLTGSLIVDRKLVVKVARCQHTGSMLYLCSDAYIVHEFAAFTTAASAMAETKRIKHIIKKWADKPTLLFDR